MGASLPFARSFAVRTDISASQKRSSVRLPEALRPFASAMRRSASRVSRGWALARVLGIGGVPGRSCILRFNGCGPRPRRAPNAIIEAEMFAPAIAFVDLETTGTTPTGDRITEIGIVRVADGEFVDEWSTLVNPECSIPEDIRVLTGITNDMVRGAPTFAEVRREVLERLEGQLFVAHNARFDYGFLKNEFRRTEVKYTADVLCTVRL